jgi:probable HAF family extracellular repeat protein
MLRKSRKLVREYALGWLACALGALLSANGAFAQQPRARAVALPLAKPALPSYQVIPLHPGCADSAAINAQDQVAFAVRNGNDARSFFYDGTALVEIPGLGRGHTLAGALNNFGQVAGSAAAAMNTTNAFLWSKTSGSVDLGLFPAGEYSFGWMVNNLGHVAGIAEYRRTGLVTAHGFRWTPSAFMEDLGTLNGRGAYAFAMNDAGMIVGDSEAAGGYSHAYAWTRGSGMMDLGTLGGRSSTARAVGAQGQVAGDSVTLDGHTHAFLWTASGGMEDLGTAGGLDSQVDAMSPNERIAGLINFGNGSRHAMAWSRSGGMVDLGTLGGPVSIAKAVNSKGQVVGYSYMSSLPHHAFVWSAEYGMLDLNKLMRNPPAGLVLETAVAISDNGSIVGTGANPEACGGIFLLKPAYGTGGPVIGPSM